MPAISQPMLDKLAEYQILRQGSEAEVISDIHQDQHNIQKYATDGVFVFVFVFVFVLAYVFVDCGVDEGRPKVGSGRG